MINTGYYQNHFDVWAHLRVLIPQKCNTTKAVVCSETAVRIPQNS